MKTIISAWKLPIGKSKDVINLVVLIYGWVNSTYWNIHRVICLGQKEKQVVIYGLCSRSCDPFHISNIILNPHTYHTRKGGLGH